MSTTLPPIPPTNLAPPPPDPVQSALNFARQSAQDEIESIERLHQRTLISLAVIVGAVTALAAVAGWIGFQNLKNSVMINTTTLTDQLVRERLDQALTKEKIAVGVQDALTKETKAALQKAIQAEISPAIKAEVERQKPEIRALVINSTAATIAARLKQRSLTASQESQLVLELTRRIESKPDLQIEIHAISGNEAQNFAHQLQGVFQRAGWKVSMASFPLDAARHGSGVVLAKMDDRILPDTLAVQQALERVDINAEIVDAKDREYINDNFTGHVSLYVLANVR